jgi:hypothetical protein
LRKVRKFAIPIDLPERQMYNILRSAMDVKDIRVV